MSAIVADGWIVRGGLAGAVAAVATGGGGNAMLLRGTRAGCSRGWFQARVLTGLLRKGSIGT